MDMEGGDKLGLERDILESIQRVQKSYEETLRSKTWREREQHGELRGKRKHDKRRKQTTETERTPPITTAALDCHPF